MRPPTRWAYGMTTVPERLKNGLTHRTLTSLAAGGFPKPRLFVDGAWEHEIPEDLSGLDVTCRQPALKTYGNWVMGLAELFIREPVVERYAMFQDDFVTGRNLRAYLDRLPYTPGGYWNLFTFEENQRLCGDKPGWYRASQRGLGAVALVFDRDAVVALLGSQHMIRRPMNATRGWKAVDGAIVTALKAANIEEYCHNPSLVQHTGVVSSMGNRRHPDAVSFRGEDFDLLTLL